MCGGKIVINKRIVHHSRDSAPTSRREANVKTIHNHLTQSGEVLVHSAAVINREINLATCPGEEAGAARFLDYPTLLEESFSNQRPHQL